LGSCSELQMIQRSDLDNGYIDIFDVTIKKIVEEIMKSTSNFAKA